MNMTQAQAPVSVDEVAPPVPAFKLTGRKLRVFNYLAANGATMANDLPTFVAAEHVGFVTDRVEQEYDDAVSYLLFNGIAEGTDGPDGPDGYTYIRLVTK
jgi:hypothetical protein